jgi:hypothetical protein
MAIVGGCHETAAKVLRALLDHGATTLEARIGSHVATFGGSNCFQTDVRLSEAIPKPGGGRYHPESIGRARRVMKRAGFLLCKRIPPNHTPRGADYPTPHGTTSKYIRWSVIGIQRPPKQVQKAEARRLRTEERHQRLGPRYGASGAITPPSPITTGRPAPPPDTELAQVLADFESLQQSARAKRTAATPQAAVRSGVDPPE